MTNGKTFFSGLATWVANLEPKLGVAFGNVKTHKEGNPLRLITLNHHGLNKRREFRSKNRVRYNT